MLNSGKKIRALRGKKNYSNSCVVRKKNYERNKKPYPPLQVKWSVPYSHLSKVLGNVIKNSYIINQNHIFFKLL